MIQQIYRLKPTAGAGGKFIIHRQKKWKKYPIRYELKQKFGQELWVTTDPQCHLTLAN